jgi:hypothetical protein
MTCNNIDCNGLRGLKDSETGECIPIESFSNVRVNANATEAIECNNCQCNPNYGANMYTACNCGCHEDWPREVFLPEIAKCIKDANTSLFILNTNVKRIEEHLTLLISGLNKCEVRRCE